MAATIAASTWLQVTMPGDRLRCTSSAFGPRLLESRIVAVGDQDFCMMPGTSQHGANLRMDERKLEHWISPG